MEFNSSTSDLSVSASDLSISLRADPGSAPGTLVAAHDSHPTTVHAICYGPNGFEEHDGDAAEHLAPEESGNTVSWLDIVGLADTEKLQQLSELFGMHRLTIEDVVNVHQRPKCEVFSDRLYLVTRLPISDTETEQISIFVGPGFVATFQERPGDSFDLVRSRIRGGSGRIRHKASDYLAYALLDAVTDAFFPVLEAIGERVEAMEDEALDDPSLETLGKIRNLKKELMVVRRTVWPMREMFNAMLRDTTELIHDNTKIYLRDCYDHAVQLIDIVENYRELASGLMDVYMSSTGNRMNEIMKVLTIVATIFIPLTFIAGIYGMNFDSAKSPLNMPELAWYYGYPFCIGLMAISGLAMVFYFWRIGFIGNRSKHSKSE